ncbi:hypothetical protein [Streptomyces sp. NPDC002104]
MSNEPQDDAYERADASKFPTGEAGQRAAAEGMAAAEGFEIVPADENAASDHPGWTPPELFKAVEVHEARQSATGSLRRKMLELFEEHEREVELHRGQQEAAHGLSHVAGRYAEAQSYEERDAIIAEYEERLSLPEAGLIRRLSKAMERVLPAIIVEAHADGQTAPQIARELGCTTRHAYQVIRDNPWTAPWVLYRASDDGQWVRVTSGQEQTSETAEDYAERILAEQVSDPTLSRWDTRVCVWLGFETEDPDDALADASRKGDRPLDH